VPHSSDISCSSSSSAAAVAAAAAAGRTCRAAAWLRRTKTWQIEMKCAFPDPTATRCCSCYNNFGKRGPILIILSLPHSQINCSKSRHKIYHLTSNLLQHYLAKFEPSTAQLYSTLFNTNVMKNRLFFCLFLEMLSLKFCFICQQRLMYNIG